jgi:hypothetical protein
MPERNCKNANNTRNASNSRETTNRKPSGTKRTPATARMPPTVWMQATAVTQATTITSAKRNRKDASNIMTAQNSRNAYNSRHESNRSADTIYTSARAGMLAKVVKPPAACREANYGRDTVKIRDDSSSRDNRNIMDVISSRPLLPYGYNSVKHRKRKTLENDDTGKVVEVFPLAD